LGLKEKRRPSSKKQRKIGQKAGGGYTGASGEGGACLVGNERKERSGIGGEKMDEKMERLDPISPAILVAETVRKNTLGALTSLVQAKLGTGLEEKNRQKSNPM